MFRPDLIAEAIRRGEHAVVITPTGNRYHRTHHLLFPRRRPTIMENEALAMGLTLCEICRREDERRLELDLHACSRNETTETETMANQNEIDRLLAQADRLLKRADELANEPEDDFHDGAILTWRRTFHEPGGTTYTYVAVKIEAAFNGPWLVCGKTGYVSWSTLLHHHLRHADGGEVWWATEYTDPELT